MQTHTHVYYKLATLTSIMQPQMKANMSTSSIVGQPQTPAIPSETRQETTSIHKTCLHPKEQKKHTTEGGSEDSSSAHHKNPSGCCTEVNHNHS